MSTSGRLWAAKGSRWAAVVVLLTVSFASAQTRRNDEAALRSVRKEIQELSARLAREVGERDDNARALRTVELEAATKSEKLQELRARLREQRDKQRALDAQLQHTRTQLAAEREALAQQVRVSYMNGREEVFKLLLSQEDPASLGRMLVYYDYFNRARSRRIADVGQNVQRLQQLGAEAAEAQAELARLTAAQAAEVAELARTREERQVVVAKLDAGITGGIASLVKLRAEEKRLNDLVTKLGALTAGFPVDSELPFAKFKGKLPWPIAGRLLGDYGQLRDGGPAKWTGVLLDAREGTPVRAIYRGRVAFADWLPGLGLLVIVDHGGGFMSLTGTTAHCGRSPANGWTPATRSPRSGILAVRLGRPCTSKFARTASP